MSNSAYTSIYLDEDSREKLRELSESTGMNRSQLVRSLIHGADGSRETRLIELVGEMADLLKVR